jgi:hypothetical protein
LSRPGRPSEAGESPTYAGAPPWGGGFDGGGGRPFKNKGSRRGLRARKRSLSF